MSKFNILPAPVEAPAKCIGCFEGGKPVIDWRMDVDGYGAVYMCTDCIIEAAGLCGLVTPAKFADLAKRRELVAAYFKDVDVIMGESYDRIRNTRAAFDAVAGPESVTIPEKPEYLHDVPDHVTERSADPNGADGQHDRGVLTTYPDPEQGDSTPDESPDK